MTTEVKPPYGGYAMTAEMLSQLFGVRITRQRVYAWTKNNMRNGFPRRVLVLGRDGKSRWLLPLAAVVEWYEHYTPATGGRPYVRKGTLSAQRTQQLAVRYHCETCRALPGEPCIDALGYPTTFHNARVDLIPPDRT